MKNIFFLFALYMHSSWAMAGITLFKDANGKNLELVNGFWFAWYAFHPDAAIAQIPLIQSTLKQRVLNSAC